MAVEPTPKAPEVDNALKAMFGVDRLESIPAMKCLDKPIGCGLPLAETKFAKATGGDGLFRDTPSAQEYRISGMCQDCQDKVFDAEEEESSTYNPDLYEGIWAADYEDRGNI